VRDLEVNVECDTVLDDGVAGNSCSQGPPWLLHLALVRAPTVIQSVPTVWG
jgi:hypothetical protein